MSSINEFNFMEWVESHSGEETIAEITFKKILESFALNKSVDEDKKRKWSRRKLEEPVNYSETAWGKMLSDPEMLQQMNSINIV
jgi:hypothetical protein